MYKRGTTINIVNGQRMPPTVITTDHVLGRTHDGAVIVESGHLRILGCMNGSLTVEPGATATVEGAHNGSTHVTERAEITISGTSNGSVTVDHGGVVIIESTGRQSGSLTNGGVVVLRGVRGGSRGGHGELRVEGAGREIEPVIEKDGTRVYRW